MLNNKENPGHNLTRVKQSFLRFGYTTGTCAAAAAKAAIEDLLLGDRAGKGVSDPSLVPMPPVSAKQEVPFSVSEKKNNGDIQVPVHLPDGRQVILRACRVNKGNIPPFLSCSEYFVIKDAGDDPDVTNGLEIHVTALLFDIDSINAENQILPDTAFRDIRFPYFWIDGGKGVGRATRDLPFLYTGQAAINPVPREMIFSSAQEAWENAVKCPENYENKGILLLVSVPGGEERAEHTFNSSLGIVGGISILGSTGIVEPMSEKAILDTMELMVKEARLNGASSIIFVPGNYGEKYTRRFLGIPAGGIPLVHCSNYIGEAFDLAAAYGFTELLLVGNIGKISKLAAGIMNTHSRVADARWEIFVAHSALLGLPIDVLNALKSCVSTEEMLMVLEKNLSLQPVLDSILHEIEKHVGRRLRKKTDFGIFVFSESFGLLGSCGHAREIAERMMSP